MSRACRRCTRRTGTCSTSSSVTPIRDTATKTITYTLTIVEADKAHIENIIFKGNTKTKEYVLRRGLPFEEGDVFDVAKIKLGINYLNNLQFFKSVAVDPQQGSALRARRPCLHGGRSQHGRHQLRYRVLRRDLPHIGNDQVGRAQLPGHGADRRVWTWSPP